MPSGISARVDVWSLIAWSFLSGSKAGDEARQQAGQGVDVLLGPAGDAGFQEADAALDLLARDAASVVGEL